MAVRTPMPPISGSGMRKPNIASEGMVCTMSMTRSTTRPVRGRRTHITPSGMPAAAATTTAMATITTCCAVARRISFAISLVMGFAPPR